MIEKKIKKLFFGLFANSVIQKTETTVPVNVVSFIRLLSVKMGFENLKFGSKCLVPKSVNA